MIYLLIAESYDFLLNATKIKTTLECATPNAKISVTLDDRNVQN